MEMNRQGNSLQRQIKEYDTTFESQDENFDKKRIERGITKMDERNTSWAAFSRRRRILTLGALPTEVAPICRQPRGYWLHVHKIDDLLPQSNDNGDGDDIS